MKKPPTPFPLTGYYGAEYFCDRRAEVKILSDNIHGGLSTVLTGSRRLGKTSLLLHVLSRPSPGLRTIYLDILPTENRHDFLNELGTAMVRNIADRKGFGKKIWDFVRSLRPTINFDNLTGTPQISFIPDAENVDERIEAILNFFEKQPDRFVIAIDEFQQILRYPEQNTDAWLRTIIQRMKNLVFIFSGSQQHLMAEIFSLPARPFYNSAIMLKIGKINFAEYSEFIWKKFDEGGIRISAEYISEILKWTDLHTFYVQLLCGRIFLNGAKEVNGEVWKEEASRLLIEQEPVYFNYRGMLTNPQWMLLKAIGREGEVFEPTSAGFINKYYLGAGPTVLRSIKSLLKMQLIEYDFNSQGRKYYKMNDLLFRRWLEMRD